MRRSRAAAWALAIATAVLLLVDGVFQVQNGAATRAGLGPFWPNLLTDLGLLAMGTVGLILTVRRASNPVGWCLSVIALIGALSPGVSGYATYGIRVHPGALPAAEWAAWIGNWIGRVSSAFMLLAFLLFPTGRLISARWRPALFLPVLVGAGFALRAFVPGPMKFLGVINPAGLDWVPRSVDDGGLGGLPLLAGSLVACASLILRYRRAGPTEREQIKWLVVPVVALILTVLTTVLTFVTDTSAEPFAGALVGLFNGLAGSLLPICMGVAILRYRLYDIDVILNRALVYGATTATIAVSFFGSIVVLQAILRPFTAGSEFAVAVSTLVSVAMAQPLRSRVQRAVDGRFYRARYDAARTLDEFSVRLRDEVDLDAVRADLLGAVADTMRPAHAGIWLRGAR
jgi:hypothetical protein